MITEKIKSKVDKIWADMCLNGIDSLTIIEQLAHLMLSFTTEDKLVEIRENCTLPPYILEKTIAELEEIYKLSLPEEIQGDIYEYLLEKLSIVSRGGLHCTPKHIREMMVELLQPTQDDIICDPACGSAGFLVTVSKYLRRKYGNIMRQGRQDEVTLIGLDIDPAMSQIAKTNLILHSVDNVRIEHVDSLSQKNQIKEQITMCLSTPPFAGIVDMGNVHNDLMAVANTKKSELLFLALYLRLLQKGGQCACIVPNGVLFSTSLAHKTIRKELIENHQLRAVISMPSGVFKPYTGVATSVLVFTKTDVGGTDKVWFYDMKTDGFTLDNKRLKIFENDIPDIIERFHCLGQEKDRKRTEQSFFVSKREITDNDYILDIAKYKCIEPAVEEIILQESQTKPLEDIAEVICGKVAKREDYSEIGIPYLRARDIQNGRVLQPNVFISQGKANCFSRQLVQEGDILLTKNWGHYKIAIVTEQDVPAIASNALFIIRPFDVSEKYLYNFLTSRTGNEMFNNQLKKVELGVTCQYIRLFDLKKIEIPIFEQDIMQSLDEIETISKVELMAIVKKLISDKKPETELGETVKNELISLGWNESKFKQNREAMIEMANGRWLFPNYTYTMPNGQMVIIEVIPDITNIPLERILGIKDILSKENKYIFILTTGKYYEIHCSGSLQSLRMTQAPTLEQIAKWEKEVH